MQVKLPAHVVWKACREFLDGNNTYVPLYFHIEDVFGIVDKIPSAHITLEHSELRVLQPYLSYDEEG